MFSLSIDHIQLRASFLFFFLTLPSRPIAIGLSVFGVKKYLCALCDFFAYFAVSASKKISVSDSYRSPCLKKLRVFMLLLFATQSANPRKRMSRYTSFVGTRHDMSLRPDCYREMRSMSIVSRSYSVFQKPSCASWYSSPALRAPPPKGETPLGIL